MTDQTNTRPEDDSEEHEFFYVVITTQTDFCDLDHDDRDVMGSYKVCVPCGLEPSVAAVAALGAVFSVISVQQSWDFERRVFDDDGHEVTPDYDLDWYDTADEHNAYVVK